jgi:hypothetical protein
MMLCAVTLLPQPLSPTTPRVRPAKSVKLTPSTARNAPSSVAKCVRSSLTSRSGAAPSCFGASSYLVDRRVQLIVSVIPGFVSFCRYFANAAWTRACWQPVLYGELTFSPAVGVHQFLRPMACMVRFTIAGGVR